MGHDTLHWKQGTAIPEPPDEMTQHTVFSMCGKLVGHFPICGWVCVIAGVLKKFMITVTNKWDDLVNNVSLRQVMEEVIVKVTCDDLV